MTENNEIDWAKCTLSDLMRILAESESRIAAADEEKATARDHIRARSEIGDADA